MPCRSFSTQPPARIMHQPLAQEKWSCGWPRPCLAYGLCLLVLPVVRSVRRPSSIDDVIWGSTWNLPDKDRISSVGIRQHADGHYSDHIRHRNALFRPLFWLVHHWNMVRWKHRIVSTIVVLNPQWLGEKFSSRTYHLYDGTIIHDSRRRPRLIIVWWVPWYPSYGTRYNRSQALYYRPRCRPMYQATIIII